MAGQVSEQLIVQVVADIQGALSDLKRIQSEFNNTSSAASSMQKSFKQQYRAMGATYDALGQHTEGVQSKMGMLKKEMLGLNTSSADGQKQMQILSRAYKSLEASLVPAGKSAMSFKEALSALGQKGMAQLDRVSGGMVSGLKDVSGALGLTAGAAAAAGAGIAATIMAWKYAIQPGIEFNMMLEQQSMAFKVMLGNASNAAVMMDELKRLSVTTPIGLGEGASGTKQLIAYGFEQKEIISNLKMMTTVAKAVNVPLNDMVYVYGTLRAQGHAYTRDITQFAMRGIPIYEYLAKVMKVSRGEVRGLVEAGKIGFTEVEAAMKAMTSSGGKFFDLLEESMKTTQGRLTVLKNTWAMLTGEMASTSMGPVNSMLASLTQIVKESEFWVIWMQSVFGLITSLVAGLLKVVATINSIISVYTNLYKASARVGKDMWEWFKSLGPVAALIKNVINPAVNWVAARFEDISRTIEKWKTQLKNFAAGVKTNFQEADMFEIDMVLGGEDETYKKAETALKGLVAKTKGSNSLSEMRTVAAEIYAISEKVGLSADYLTQVYAVGAGKSIEGYDALKGAIDQTQVSFDIFQKRMDKFNIDDRIRRVSGIGAANVIYDAMNDSYEGMKRLTDQMMKFGMTKEEALTLVSGEAGKLRDTLFELIQTMSGDEEFRLAPAGQATIDELIKKYLALTEVKKGEGKGDDAILKYMAERAEWLNIEQAETLRLLGYRVQLSAEDTAQNRAMDSISYKYEMQRAALYENEEIMADTVRLQLRLAILAEEETEERRKATYELQKAYLANVASVVGDFEQQLTMAEAIYQLDREQLKAKIYGAEVQAEADALEYKHRQEILELYQKQYDLLNQGDEEFFKKMKQGLVKAFSSFTDNMAAGNGKAALGSLAATAGKAVVAGTQGTDLGASISGANPMMQFISALSETVLAVENVNKVLNWMKTIMEGVTAVIEGPLNDAFQPLVNILTKIGEIIGTMLTPFIDYLGWVFETLANFLLPFLEIIKQVHRILAPIITLLLKVMTPLISILDAISQSMGLSWDMVDMQKDQVDAMSDLLDRQIKSLQDLYNIGAITGDEYSAMLANLQGTEEDSSSSSSNPGWTQFLESMDALLAQVVAWCNDTYELFVRPIIAALQPLGQAFIDTFAALKPAFDGIMQAIQPLGAALQAIISALGGVIAAVVGIVANLIASPLVQGIIAFLAGTFVELLKGALEIIIGIFEFLAPVLELIGNVLLFFKAGWDFIVGFFTGDSKVMAAALELMKKILQGIWNAIKGFVNIFIRAINWVIGVFEAIGDFLNGAKGRPDFGKIPLLETGTMNVPEDMIAKLHQGEMVVPKKFASELRGSLKNPNQSAQGQGNTIIEINVPGNLVTEREFYKTVGGELNKMMARGYT